MAVSHNCPAHKAILLPIILGRAVCVSNQCFDCSRVDDALTLIKALARMHGSMQERTLNSVIRALAASHVDRALRLLSLLKTLGLQATRHTAIVLIGACAKASRSVESAELYW